MIYKRSKIAAVAAGGKAVALAALLAALAACARPQAATVDGEYLHLVAPLAITRDEHYEISREFAGLVDAAQSTDIGFELAGQVERLLVDEGDAVTRGQVIAEQDTRLLQSDRDDLSAQRRDVEARLELNRLNSARARELNDKGFASEQRVDELAAERRSLTAAIGRLDAALAANRTRLEKARIKAPYAATIARRFIDEGAVVDGGSPVFRLIESARLEARVGIPVRLLEAVQLGDQLPVRVAGTEHSATVIGINRDVTRATLTVPVRLGLGPEVDAVPGDQAYLRLIETVDASGFWVPLEALTDGLRGLWNVYVLTPGEAPDSHVLEARDVRVLHATAERAFINGALTDGEQIVAAGLQRVVPGQRVRAGDAVAMTSPADAVIGS